MSKPLRPLWITPDSTLPDAAPVYASFYPVILCTASRYTVGVHEFPGYGYVQGAGDDSEGWSNGLTAQLFWTHREELMEAVNKGVQGEELAALVKRLVASDNEADEYPAESIERSIPAHKQWEPWLVGGTTGVFVSSLAALAQLFEQKCLHRYNGIIVCDNRSNQQLAEQLKEKFLHLKCSPGKLGSRGLRRELPKIRVFLNQIRWHPTVLISSSADGDLAVGVALAILCAFIDPNGESCHAPFQQREKVGAEYTNC
jgi:tRNA A64-2'-O-ribosylphosphate transferase